eukprot:1140543-Pelagomonas_calceolata.AAC.2
MAHVHCQSILFMLAHSIPCSPAWPMFLLRLWACRPINAPNFHLLLLTATPSTPLLAYHEFPGSGTATVAVTWDEQTVCSTQYGTAKGRSVAALCKACTRPIFCCLSKHCPRSGPRLTAVKQCYKTPGQQRGLCMTFS